MGEIESHLQEISMSSRTRNVVVLPLLALVLLAGCKDVKTTPIKTLLDDPGRFDGKTVAVEGDVTRAYGAFGYGVYQLNDGTGSLNVVTRTQGAPRTGAHVGAMGTFRSAFTLGTESMVVLEETKRMTPR